MAARRRRQRSRPAAEDATRRTSPPDFEALCTEIPAQLLARLGAGALPHGGELEALIADEVNQRLLGADIALERRRRLIRRIYDQIQGLDVLQPYMDHPDITEIMVNGPDTIFIEEAGRLYAAPERFRNREHLTDVIVHFFSRENRAINYWQPIADLRLPDGSRANAVLPPVAPDGPILTIRKFTGIRHEGPALVASGMLSQQALDYLEQAVRRRETLFICGGTGTGKTTLLNVLSQAIPADERIVTIEDSAELQLPGRSNLVRLECRPASSDGGGEVSMTALIRSALRMRPDRLIVGEVRGAEAYDLMVSMNTGHRGTLCTVHANSCADLLPRLATLVLEHSRLPYEAVRRELAASIDLIVLITRRPGGSRVVSEICRVTRDAAGDAQLTPLLRREEVCDASQTPDPSLS